MKSTLPVFVIAILLTVGAVRGTAPAPAGHRAGPPPSPAQQSAEAGIDHLRRVMDTFHDRFPVYEDVSSAGNHFHAYTKIPDQNAAVQITGSSASSPHTGATAIRCEFANTPGANFGGFYFQNGIPLPDGNAPVGRWAYRGS